MKSNTGGARPGAGRKPGKQWAGAGSEYQLKSKKVFVYLTPDLRDFVASQPGSQSSYIAGLIEKDRQAQLQAS